MHKLLVFFVLVFGLGSGLQAMAQGQLHLKYFKIQKKMRGTTQSHLESLLVRPPLSEAYVVQFKRPLRSADRRRLKSLGVKVSYYIPDNAFVVLGATEAIEQLKRQRLVAKVLPMQPYYRLQGRILKGLARKRASSSQRKAYHIVPVHKSLKRSLVNRVRQLGGTAPGVARGSLYIAARLTASQLIQVASLDEVLWIDERTRVGLDMDNANVQGGAQSLRQKTGMSFRGRGIRGHVLEGIYPEHPDYRANQYRKAPIAVGNAQGTGHGQSTFGQIFGSGAGNPKALGLLPDAQGLYTNYNEVISKPGARYVLTENLIKNHGVMFQTASWGNARTTEYTSISAEMDNIIFNLDLPVTQSQSNAGNRQSRPQAWAKNIISVGALNHHNNADPSDDNWRGASIGPATDGRIKPDVSAYYDRIDTTGGRTGYTQNFGGTSGATPIVAGHVGMIIEMWTSGILGNRLPFKRSRRRIFANRPHFTTVKALLINSARQYKFAGADHNRTRVHQGWGFPNVANLVDSKKHIRVVNEDHVLKTGQSRSYSFNVASGSPQFKVTMVYADPEANPASEKQLVNDLDLRVTSPSGQVYWGNHGLLANMFSRSGGQPNDKDTVENVFIARPAAGTWKIEVIGRSINVDGHVETQEVDADFALVARAGN